MKKIKEILMVLRQCSIHLLLMVVSHYGYIYMLSFVINQKKLQQAIGITTLGQNSTSYIITPFQNSDDENMNKNYLFWTILIIIITDLTFLTLGHLFFTMLDNQLIRNQTKNDNPKMISFIKFIAKGKLKPKRKSEPKLKELLKVSIWNILFLQIPFIIIVCWLPIYVVPWWFYRVPKKESLGRTMSLIILYGLTYDLMFYFGHWIMHKYEWAMKYHDKHHQSQATTAIAGYYMGKIDFIVEHCFMILAIAIWREITPASLAIVLIGEWNTLCTHSAWELYIGQNVREHYMHHNYDVGKNLGIFIGRFFGTHISWQDVPKDLSFFQHEKYGISNEKEND